MRVSLISGAVVVALVGCTSSESGHDHHGGHADHADHGKAGAPVAKADGEAPKKVDREQVDADGIVRRGVMTADAALTMTEVATKASELDGKTIKVTGKVDSVCQPMGCWFVMKGDGGETIRVSSKGHDVFMPKSSAGRIATAVGEFKVRTISKEQAQHFEDEKDRKPGEERKVFTEDVKELSIALTGVELRPAS
jgi:hypothetical protein